jgi:hypothetical protein
VVTAVLLVEVGPAVPTTTNSTAVVVAPDNGHENARNMLCHICKTSNKLENFLHFVGYTVESMMMHGLANPKFKNLFDVCCLK